MMKSKIIDINGARFVFSEAGGTIMMTVLEDPKGIRQVVVPMSKEQCSTLANVMKIMSGQMREHQI
jgi:hypothetical protein